MKRIKMAALALLLGVGAILLLRNNHEPDKLEGKQPTIVRYIGDDGLERIGIDFD